ncbi:hypothetical protein HYH02_014552 [Chlamydomonas schloesseri]|uniref:Uncharacterized protein n=1 Tax=Chlamydomonas schloesseri TaxID=2026947 RepID=A0A835VWI2_9CHLO|nr:hypothetical protein HYH02_014552 [Chlamydomonas schloesseri]|eukprot:KAG2427721.1 hypothetical protein HYH02_014552 [Chlamydomonas schloesseri]
MKRTGGQDGAPSAKRPKEGTGAARSRSTSPPRYDAAAPLRERLEQYCTPRKRNTDRAKSRPASELDPKVRELARSLPITYLRCGEPPKLARLLGAHDANAQNVTVDCQCDTCQEWNREDELADSEADPDENSPGRGADAHSSSNSSTGIGDRTSSSVDGAADGDGGPGASSFRGRLYNLPQWLEHCTGLRISGLDPKRQPAQYRDLVLSAVDVVDAAGGEDARPGLTPSSGSVTAATARSMSLRDCLKHLTRTELAKAAGRFQARQPGAGSSGAAHDCLGALVGRRLHVFYAEELPRARWFSGAVLQPASDLVSLQVEWEAWTDYQGVTNPATQEEVLLGVTLLHWGPSAPQQLPDCPEGAHICPLPSLELQQQQQQRAVPPARAACNLPAGAPGSSSEVAGSALVHEPELEPRPCEIAGAQQGQFARPARRPADHMMVRPPRTGGGPGSGPVLDQPAGPRLHQDGCQDPAAQLQQEAAAPVAGPCRQGAYPQLLPEDQVAHRRAGHLCVELDQGQGQNQQVLCREGLVAAEQLLAPNTVDADVPNNVKHRSNGACTQSGSHDDPVAAAPVSLTAAGQDSRAAAAAGVERLLAVITTHSMSSTSTSTSTASQHGAGGTAGASSQRQAAEGTGSLAAILLPVAASNVALEPPIGAGGHTDVPSAPNMADCRSPRMQASPRGLMSLHRMPLTQQPSALKSQAFAPLPRPAGAVVLACKVLSQDYELHSSSSDGGEHGEERALPPEPDSSGGDAVDQGHPSIADEGKLADVQRPLAEPVVKAASRRASPAVLHPSWFDPAVIESIGAATVQEALLQEEEAASPPAAPPLTGPGPAQANGAAAAQPVAASEIAQSASPQRGVSVAAELAIGPEAAAQDGLKLPPKQLQGPVAAVEPTEGAVVAAPPLPTAAAPGAPAVGPRDFQREPVECVPTALAEIALGAPVPTSQGASARGAASGAPYVWRLGAGEACQGPKADEVAHGSSGARGCNEATRGGEAQAAEGQRGRGPGLPPVLAGAGGGNLKEQEDAAQQQLQQEQQQQQQSSRPHADANARHSVPTADGAFNQANAVMQSEAMAMDGDAGDAKPAVSPPVAQPEGFAPMLRLVVPSPRFLIPEQSDRWALANRCRELGERFSHALSHGHTPHSRHALHRQPSPNQHLPDGGLMAGPTCSATGLLAAGESAAESRVTILLANATNSANTRVSPQQYGALEAALQRYMQLQLAADKEAGAAESAAGALQLSVVGPEPCSRVSLEHPELVVLPLDLQHGHMLLLAAEHHFVASSSSSSNDNDLQQRLKQPSGPGRDSAGTADALRSVASAPLPSARSGPTPVQAGVSAAGMVTSYVMTCSSRDWAAAGADVGVELAVKLITCAIPGAVGLHQVVLTLAVRMPAALHHSPTQPAVVVDWHALTRLAVWLGLGLNQVASTPSKAGASSCATQQADEGAQLLRQLLDPALLLAPLPQPRAGVCYRPQEPLAAQQAHDQPARQQQQQQHDQLPAEQQTYEQAQVQELEQARGPPGPEPSVCDEVAAVAAAAAETEAVEAEAAGRAARVQQLVLALNPVLLRALEEFELRRDLQPLLEGMSVDAAAQGWAVVLSQLSTAAGQQEMREQQATEAGATKARTACAAVRRLHGLLGVAEALAAEAAETRGLSGSSECESARRERCGDIGPGLAQLLELYWAAKRCFRIEEWWEGVVRLRALMAAMQSAGGGRQHQRSVLEVCSRLLFSPKWPPQLQVPGMGPPDPARLAAAWDEVLEEARSRRQLREQAEQEEPAEEHSGQQQLQQTLGPGNSLQQQQHQQQRLRQQKEQQQQQPAFTHAVGARAAAAESQQLAVGSGLRRSVSRPAEPPLGARPVAQSAAQAAMRAAPNQEPHKSALQQGLPRPVQQLVNQPLHQQQHQQQQQQQQQTVQQPRPRAVQPAGQQQQQQQRVQQQQPALNPFSYQLLQNAQLLQNQVLNQQLGQQMLQLIQQQFQQQQQPQQQHVQRQQSAYPQSTPLQQAAAAVQAPAAPRHQQSFPNSAGAAAAVATANGAVTGAAPPGAGAGAGAHDHHHHRHLGIMVRGWREVGPESSGQHRLYTMLYEYEGLQLDTTYSVDSDQVPLLELSVGESRELALHTVANSVASQVRAVGISPPPHVERALLAAATTTPEHLAWLVAQLKAYRSGRAGGQAAPMPAPPAPAPAPAPPAVGRPVSFSTAYTSSSHRQQQQQQQQQRAELQQPHYSMHQQAVAGNSSSWTAVGGVQGGAAGAWPGQTAVPPPQPAAAQWLPPVPAQSPHAAAAAAAAAAVMGQQYYAAAAVPPAQHVYGGAVQAPAPAPRVSTLGDVWDQLGA